MIAKERIAVTADRACVVPDGHADARYVIAGVGCVIDPKDAKRYGLRDGKLPPQWGLKLGQWRAKRQAEEDKQLRGPVETKG